MTKVRSIIVSLIVLCALAFFVLWVIDQPNRSARGRSERKSMGLLTESDLIDIATVEARKGMKIPYHVKPTVGKSGDFLIIEWPIKQTDPPVAQGDYYSQVTIHKTTGEIVKILIAP